MEHRLELPPRRDGTNARLAHGARRLENLERAKADKTPRSKAHQSTFETADEPVEPVSKTIRTYLIALGGVEINQRVRLRTPSAEI